MSNNTVFETKINAIRVGTVGSLTDVVRKVEFTVKGSDAGQSFELPQVVDLLEPQAESFKPLNQLTESDVVQWVEENFTNMESVKAHISMVVAREVAKASLESKPLPWAPAVPAPESTPVPTAVPV